MVHTHAESRPRAGNHRPLMESLGGIALACAILYGGLQVIDGTMTTGELASFMAALLAAYKPMKNIANLNATLQQGLAAAQRVFSVLDLRSNITEREDARPILNTRRKIRFEDVHFRYTDKSTALSGISIWILRPAKLLRWLVRRAQENRRSSILSQIRCRKRQGHYRRTGCPRPHDGEPEK